MMLSPVLLILLPFVVGLFVRRRMQLQWKVVLLGAGMFLLAQAIKALFAVPVLTRGILAPGSFGLILFSALLPGVWEEVTKYVPLRKLRVQSWDTVVAFGLGYGGVEAVFIGVQSLALMLAVASGQPLPELPGAVQAQLAPESAGLAVLFTVAALVERLSGMAIHAGFAFMHAQALRTGRWGYSLLAVVLHTLLDITAGLVQNVTGGSASLVRTMVPTELLYVTVGVIAVVYIRRVLQRPFPTA